MTMALDPATGDAFAVDVVRRPGVDVVAVSGELDIATAVRLRQILVDGPLCTQPGLVVDLTGVAFLDSTGIGALVAAWRHAGAHDVRFALACPPGQARTVLELVQLHRVITVADSADDAVARLAPASSPV